MVLDYPYYLGEALSLEACVEAGNSQEETGEAGDRAGENTYLK